MWVETAVPRGPAVGTVGPCWCKTIAGSGLAAHLSSKMGLCADHRGPQGRTPCHRMHCPMMTAVRGEGSTVRSQYRPLTKRRSSLKGRGLSACWVGPCLRSRSSLGSPMGSRCQGSRGARPRSGRGRRPDMSPRSRWDAPSAPASTWDPVSVLRYALLISRWDGAQAVPGQGSCVSSSGAYRCSSPRRRSNAAGRCDPRLANQ
jgi:hypothetical protein